MNLDSLTRRDGPGRFADRLALRFAQNARPTASQGEAPAKVIGKTRFQEERQVQLKIMDQTDRRRLTGATHNLETAFTQNT